MRKRYVSFGLAGGRYCVPVEQVLQILRLENLIEIPKPPPYVAGVINLRGDIIPVVNLRDRLEMPRKENGLVGAQEQRRRRVIIVRVGGKTYGLNVDEVREIVEIEEGGIKPDAATLFGARADFLAGMAQREEGVYLVLDLQRVLGTGRDLPGITPGH